MTIVLVGFVFSFFQHTRQSPDKTAPIQPAQAQASFGIPVRIQIPSINVDAAIGPVGVAPDGSMDVPKDPSDTVWYQPGPRPGETGSAVIAGHVDWKNGARAVFSDLHNLKPGDRIVIQDEQKVTVTFLVRASRAYDANADASDVFTSNDGQAHLNLVTCSGVWDKAAKGFTERLVVFTDKVME